ncbi:MAG: DUF3419 family protein [Oligoflexus sp.]|nr:DUF3419 family protein [Oligoflexus sp.]
MSANYFNDLNYSLANEDTRLELEMCRTIQPKSILSICGSGGRFLPLLAAGPKKIVALDLAPQQLYLAELRQRIIFECDFDGFLLFWGFPPFKTTENRKKRKAIFESLTLSAECRRYFVELFTKHDYEGLIYKGKWERTIIGIPKILRRFIGGNYDKMFEFKTQAEQDAFMKSKLADNLWKLIPRLVVLLLGNAAFFNACLYRGHFVKKNVSGSYYDFYRLAFRRLFFNGLARENYFLQLCFLGEIRYPEGVPVEGLENVFLTCKKTLKKNPEINLVLDNVLEYSRKSDEKFDFVSLSDVPSYFVGEDERNYMQGLKRNLNPGAVVIVRCYLRIPEGTILTGYEDVTETYRKEIDAEKVQMYNTFVYRFKG